MGNKVVVECYIDSEPDRWGYRKRMYRIWNERELFAVSEQRLVDQVRQIKVKGWLTDAEIEEIRESRRILTQPDNIQDNNECNVNESIYQENTSQNNQGTEEIFSETGDELEDVVYIDGNEYTSEELEVAKTLSNVLRQEGKTRLPALRTVNKGVLKREVQKMNHLLSKIRSDSITTTNDLIYAAAVVTTENAGVKIKKGKRQTEPMWKRRMEDQILRMRKNLNRVEELKKGRKIKDSIVDELQRRYWLKEKGLITESEELR